MSKGICFGFGLFGQAVIVRLNPGTYIPSVRIRSKADVLAEVRTLRGY